MIFFMFSQICAFIMSNPHHFQCVKTKFCNIKMVMLLAIKIYTPLTYVVKITCTLIYETLNSKPVHNIFSNLT